MNKKQIITFIFLISLLLLFHCTQSITKNIISLKGKWLFQTDPEDIGTKNNWYQSKLTDTIILPGSMKDSNKGDELSLNTKWTGSIYDSSWYFRPDIPGTIINTSGKR